MMGRLQGVIVPAGIALAWGALYWALRPSIAGVIPGFGIAIVDGASPLMVIALTAMWDLRDGMLGKMTWAAALLAALAAGVLLVLPIASAALRGAAIDQVFQPGHTAEQIGEAAALAAFCIAIWVAKTTKTRRTEGEDGARYERSARDTFGSGRLAKKAHVANLIASATGLPLGEWPGTGEILRWDGQGTALTIAPSRAGKGLSAVVPALLEWDGGMVVLDPKGQNYAIAAMSRRLRGQRVVVLNPFDLPALNGVSARWNPMDVIEQGAGFQESVEAITDALVVWDPTDKAHFFETARVLVAGGVAYVAEAMYGRQRSLRSVYELFVREENLTLWMNLMSASPNVGAGLPQRAASIWLRAAPEERGSIYSTALRNLSFLLHERFRDCLGSSSFKMTEVARGNCNLFACLPADAPAEYHRFYRLVVTGALRAMVRAAERPKRDVLFLLDEMSVLGRMDRLLNRDGAGAVTWGGDYGIKIWGILQSPAQLEAAYGREGARIWRSNVAALQVFGVSKADKETSEEIASLIGDTTVHVRGESTNTGKQVRGIELVGSSSSGDSESVGEQRRLLVTADELRRLPPDHLLLLLRDVQYPVRARRLIYPERQEWGHKFARNPYYSGDQDSAIDLAGSSAPATG